MKNAVTLSRLDSSPKSAFSNDPLKSASFQLLYHLVHLPFKTARLRLLHRLERNSRMAEDYPHRQVEGRA